MTSWRVRCPTCGTAAAFAPLQFDLERHVPPEPTEELEWGRLTLRCVAPTVPLTRQLRRLLERGGSVPICGERFVVRLA